MLKRPLIALTPAKGRNPKSRLSSLLTPEQRARLTEWMLRRVLSAVRSLDDVSEVRLVGPGANDDLRALAQREGVSFCPEQAATLNGALQAELDRCLVQQHCVLIVFSDLPLIEASALKGLIAQAQQQAADLTLTPDGHRQGTNALLYQGGSSLKLVYGACSFERFMQQALAKQWKAAVFQDSSLARDLDTPADWQALAPQLLEQGLSLEVCAEASR